MSPHPDNEKPSSFLGAAAMIVLPIACCGLPLLLASGALGGIGAALGSPWLISGSAALAVAAVVWFRGRHSPPTDENCCPPSAPQTADESAVISKREEP